MATLALTIAARVRRIAYTMYIQSMNLVWPAAARTWL
jgi:hypothetical protein